MSEETPKAAQAPHQVQVQLDESIAQGSYANLALISHTESEFVLDFIFVQPTKTGAKVQSRVIMNPRQVKRLASTLVNTVAQYEKRFGPLAPPTTPEDKLVH